MRHILARSITNLLRLADSLQWLPPLLIRLFVGYMFFELGWAKIHSIDAFTQRFAGWGIPYPGLNARLSAYTECIGGVLIVLGLLTRIASIPMLINMVVAIITVKMKQVGSLSDFVELDEPLYLLSFFWLVISGPGYISVDHLAWRFFRRWFKTSEPCTQASETAENVGSLPRQSQ